MEHKDILKWVLSSAVGIVLFFVIIFLINAGFVIINNFVPSNEISWFRHSSDVLSALPIYVAALLILFPLLFVLSRKIRKMFEGNAQLDKLSYTIIVFILVVSAGLIIVPVIVLLGSLLRGDISFSFLLKILFTISVGGGTFYYYLGVLRRFHTRPYIFGTIAGLAVSLIVVVSIFLINPVTLPEVEKAHRTLGRLGSTVHSLEAEYLSDGILPNALDAKVPSYYRDYYDFDKEEDNLRYTRTGRTTYTLCASFEALPRFVDLPQYPDFDVTKIGENCFERSVVE